jgi:hypothetical protein
LPGRRLETVSFARRRAPCLGLAAALLVDLVAAQSPAAAADIAAPAPPAAPATMSERWNATFASEVRYYTWSSSRGYPTLAGTNPGHGTEIYTPLALQVVGRPTDDVKLDFVARGGWVSARQSTAGLSGDVSTATDTQLNGTVTYYGISGIQPFVSLSSNLPTGQSALFGTAANARMDPDLVEISSFGEGYNVGPTVGFNLPLTQTVILSAAGGYTWRGNYNRENSLSAQTPLIQTPTQVEPSRIYTATGSLATQIGQFATKLTASWSTETTTGENGLALYRAGDRYVVSGVFSYDWQSAGLTSLTVSGAHSNRNDVKLANVSDLVREIMNTNADVYKVGLQHLFPVGQLTIGPTGSWLIRERNSYDPTTLQFVPEKERYTVGLLTRYAATDKLTFNARADYVMTHENQNSAPGGQKFSAFLNAFIPGSAVPVVASTGWQCAIGANASF